MRWVIFKCVQISLLAIGLVFIVSVNASAWSVGESAEFVSSEAKTFHPSPCGGEYTSISVKGEGSIAACVMGDDTKVASYLSPNGVYGYAVRFPFETDYYPLDVCGRVWGCVYSDKTDTFATPGGAVYKNFVGQLKQVVRGGIVRYIPNEESALRPIASPAGVTMTGETAAISANGEWVLIEMRQYGIFRINIKSLEVRRVIVTNFGYGPGTTPRVELAISNDGKTVTMMGFRLGVAVVIVDDTCGDRPKEEMQPYYTGAVTACSYVNTPTGSYVNGFIYASMPRFSDDGTTLSFNAHSYRDPTLRIVLFSSDKPVDGMPRYVAIGDSFTSGEGETEDKFYVGGPANRCHVSMRSYPLTVAASWSVDGYSAACSGATMETARKEKTATHGMTQLDFVEKMAPKLVTVGIGGNDAGMVGKLKGCLGLGTCEWAKNAEQRQRTALEIKSLYPRLVDFYKEVQAKASGPVVIIGYPKIISSSPECKSPIGAMLNEAERIFMNESIIYLNRVIRAAAGTLSLRYISVDDVFAGEEICKGITSPVMNEVRFGDDFPGVPQLPSVKIIGAESFHPNPTGHARIAERILSIYPDMADFNICADCTVYSGVPSPSGYWSGPADVAKSQQVFGFLNKVTVKKGDSFKVTFPAFSFKPRSEVVLELHSEVKNLGTLRAMEDGSLEANIQLSEGEPGQHSVHAIGKGYAGSDVELYDFVTVEGSESNPGQGDGVAVGPISVVSTPGIDVPATSLSLQPKVSTEPLAPNTQSNLSNGTKEEILGASVASNLNTPVGAARTQPAQPNELTNDTSKDSSINSLQVIVVLCGVLLVATGMYGLYRRKHVSSQR